MQKEQLLAPFIKGDIYGPGNNLRGAELELVFCKRQKDGTLTPANVCHHIIPKIWAAYPDEKDFFDVEFSAYQIEIKAGPYADFYQVVKALLRRIKIVREFAAREGYEAHAIAYIHGPVEIMTNPLKPRYEAYRKRFPEKADAMVRVAGLHIHTGVESFKESLRIYNAHVEALLDIINRGWMHPDRLKAFVEIIFNGFFSPKYKGLDCMYKQAVKFGFQDDLSLDFGGIRQHPIFGTVEDRPFDPRDTEDGLLEFCEFIEDVNRGVRLAA